MNMASKDDSGVSVGCHLIKCVLCFCSDIVASRRMLEYHHGSGQVDAVCAFKDLLHVFVQNDC